MYVSLTYFSLCYVYYDFYYVGAVIIVVTNNNWIVIILVVGYSNWAIHRTPSISQVGATIKNDVFLLKIDQLTKSLIKLIIETCTTVFSFSPEQTRRLAHRNRNPKALVVGS